MTFGHTIRLNGWLRTLLCVLVAASLVAPTGSSALAQTWQDAIDYTKLKSRLAGQVPTGAGGIVSMAEGTLSGASYVDPTSPEFNGIFDPNLAAVQFTDASGAAGNGNSNHALGVARHFYGDLTSIAPGANQAVLYEAGNWLTNILHYDNNGGIDNGAQPGQQLFRVQNHSWIVQTLGTTLQDQSALRRFDWIIENDDVTEVVGVNNAAFVLAQPALLVQSYNAIAVGRTDGFHSRGATTVYGPGRSKPDIVAPINLVSHAAPIVGSVAALLHQSGAGTDAVKSETMKATLLAGATKQEFANYLETLPAVPMGVPSLEAKPWDRTPTRPLDEIFGAGEVNAYNSYLIQLGGQHAGVQAAPTTTAGSYGWDYQNHKGDSAVGDIYYNFEIAAGSTASELSIILAWNVKVTDTNPAPGQFTPVESLQNLDLRLYTSEENVLSEPLDPLRTSVSTVSNVEHIYQTNLGPGTYTLKVSGAADWDFGLAWRMTTAFDQISADFDEDGVVDGADFLTWQRNFGTLLGAAHGDGDADGDGDVDADDLTAVQNGVMPPPPAVANLRVAAVPEPTTGALAAGALLVAAGWSLRRTRRG